MLSAVARPWANRGESSMTDTPLEPISITVPTALKLSGLGRTKLYELIASKQIRTVRVGARRLVDYASLKAFLTSREA
jgi:excisionase family DNA binding protein